MANIEYVFSKEFLNKLKLKEEDLIHYITSTILEPEEYALSLGSLKALREIRQDYNELAKAYFSNN